MSISTSFYHWDNETPIEETMEALQDVVRAFSARNLGPSSLWPGS